MSRLLSGWVCVLLTASSASAQATYTFAWDPPLGGDPVVGYYLQVGAASGVTDRLVDAGAATTVTSTFIATSYVRVVAYNEAGIGPPSNEVIITVEPPPPTDPCVADPLTVTVTQWPANKRSQPLYSSNYPATYRFTSVHGNTVNAITFTDARLCAVTVTR